jgi:predicted dinucleotide-binding enzyme
MRLSEEQAVKYNIAGAGLVGNTLADIFPRQGIRALIANSHGPKSRAEMAAEQFEQRSALRKMVLRRLDRTVVLRGSPQTWSRT